MPYPFSAGEELTAADLNKIIEDTRQDNFTADADIEAESFAYPSGNMHAKQAVVAEPTSQVQITDPAMSGSPIQLRVLREDTNRVFAVGYIGGSSNVLYIRAGTVNAAETDITWGSAVLLTTDQIENAHVTRIDTNKYMVVWVNNSGAVKAEICTMTGTVVAGSSATTVDTGASTSAQVGCDKVSTTKAVVTWVKSSDSEAQMQIVSISGSTITANTTAAVSSTTTVHGTSVAMLTSSLGVVTYNKNTSGWYAKAFTISGTTPTLGTEAQLGSASVDVNWVGHGVIRLMDNKFLFVGNNNGTAAGQAVAGTVSGTTITAGSGFAVTYFKGYHGGGAGAITRAANNVAIVGGSRVSGNSEMYALEIIGTVVSSIGSIELTAFGGSNGQDFGVCLLRPFRVLILGANSADDEGEIVVFRTNASKRIGGADTAIAKDAVGPIIYRSNKLTVSSGLTAGGAYNVGWDGKLTAEESVNQVYAGIALDTTTLLMA